MFSRGKRATSSDKKIKKEKRTPGALEVFLDNEGFLGTANPRPHTPSAPSSRPSTSPTYGRHNGHKLKLSEDTSRPSTASHGKSRTSFSAFGDASDELRSRPKRTASHRTKSFLSFGKTAHGEPGHPIHNFSRPGPNYVVEKESNTSGWLRRCISTSLKHRPSTPSSSMTPPPPYDGSLIFEDDDFTALPAMPGCAIEPEPSRPPSNLASGAAARAAAAAQNEILGYMRNMTLAEPHLTRDSESGVGIEVRDSGETMTEFDFEIPVVRQGMKIRDHYISTSLTFAQILYLLFHRNSSNIYFLIWMLARYSMRSSSLTIGISQLALAMFGRMFFRQSFRTYPKGVRPSQAVV